MTPNSNHSTGKDIDDNNPGGCGCGDSDTTLPKFLMINQLWLWKLDESSYMQLINRSVANEIWTGTVVTASPTRLHNGPQDTFIDIICRSLNEDAWASPETLIQQILLHCLRFPEEFDRAGVGYHILDIFASWITKHVSPVDTIRRHFEI